MLSNRSFGSFLSLEPPKISYSPAPSAINPLQFDDFGWQEKLVFVSHQTVWLSRLCPSVKTYLTWVSATLSAFEVIFYDLPKAAANFGAISDQLLFYFTTTFHFEGFFCLSQES